MSFYADKKREHEMLAEKALAEKDYGSAFFHTAKAADLGFTLAEQSSGRMARAYLKDAEGLLALAEDMKRKAGRNKRKDQTRKDDGGSGSPNKIATDDQGEHESGKWQNPEKKRMKLDDVAGLEKVKEQIRLRMILPFKYPEKAAKHGLTVGGGILMYGPPGTGKTFIARATAGELDAAFFSIRPSEIMSKWVGEAEQRIRELFAEAREHKLSVIFVDEVEALVPARSSSNSTVMQRVVPQFLAELEGVDSADANPMLFMGATNEPWLIDPAMMRPGRFDVKVHVGLPDEQARREILEMNFNAQEELIGEEVIDELIEKTIGYSGADIKAFVQAAKQKGFTRDISESGFNGYDMVLLDECLKEVPPSVSKKQIVKYKRWESEQR